MCKGGEESTKCAVGPRGRCLVAKQPARWRHFEKGEVCCGSTRPMSHGQTARPMAALREEGSVLQVYEADASSPNSPPDGGTSQRRVKQRVTYRGIPIQQSTTPPKSE